jgi:lipopolysaccharide exporter
MSDLKAKAKAGALWVSLDVATSGLVQVVRLAILARFFISPDEFGLFALATSAVVLISSLSTLGTIPYVLFRTDAGQSAVSGIFWLNVASGLAFCIVTALCSGPIAAGLGNAELAEPLRVLSLMLAIDAVGNPLMAILVRDFEFKSHALIEVSSTVSGTAAALLIAAGGAGLWALIFGVLGQRLVRMLLAVWWSVRHRVITLTPSSAEFRRFSRFSQLTVGERLVGTVNERTPYICLGWYQDAAQVGTFAVASNLVTTPLQYVMNIAMRTVTPVLARLQQERGRLSHAYFLALEMTMTVIAPAFLGLLVTAPLIVPLILGPSWISAVPTLQFTCVSLTLHAIFYFSGALIIGAGRPNAGLALTAIQAPGILLASFIGAKLGGAVGVAMGLAAVSVATVVPYYFLVTRRVLGPCLRPFFASFGIPIAMALAMALCVTLIARLLAGANPFLALAVEVVSGAIIYGGLLLIVRPRLAREIALLVPINRLQASLVPNPRLSN